MAGLGAMKWLNGCAGVLAVLALSVSGEPVLAATCPAEQFGAAVDQSGAALRAYNAEAQPRLKERISVLKSKKGWPDEGYEEKAYDYLQDDRMAGFDTRSNDLLTKIDTLGQQGEKGGADCAALDDLKAAGGELLGVMKAKSAYMLERIDKETGVEVAATPPGPAPAEKQDAPATKQEAPAMKQDAPAVKQEAPAVKPAAPAVKQDAPVVKQDSPAAKPAVKTGEPWSAKTTTLTAPPPEGKAPPPAASDAYVPPRAGEQVRAGEPMPSVDVTTDEAGYTIDEIRDATRGFFGTISTNLASVIEHTFSIAGRPTGYVLGQEGGGAFLAGLRYGDGTLFMRTGGTQRVYWHGPTIGADIGAAGSRTLFLIYKLKDPADLFRSFTGLDGSAYFVGGFGVTLMKGGPVIMAPIRSGLGLRLGANIGYVRFTGRQTWNPF